MLFLSYHTCEGNAQFGRENQPKKGSKAFTLIESLQEATKRQVDLIPCDLASYRGCSRRRDPCGRLTGALKGLAHTVTPILRKSVVCGGRYSKAQDFPHTPLKSGYTGRVSPRTTTVLFFFCKAHCKFNISFAPAANFPFSIR
jgi:hypothetical protein